MKGLILVAMIMKLYAMAMISEQPLILLHQSKSEVHQALAEGMEDETTLDATTVDGAGSEDAITDELRTDEPAPDALRTEVAIPTEPEAEETATLLLGIATEVTLPVPPVTVWETALLGKEPTGSEVTGASVVVILMGLATVEGAS